MKAPAPSVNKTVRRAGSELGLGDAHGKGEQTGCSPQSVWSSSGVVRFASGFSLRYKNSLSLHHPADGYSGGDAYRKPCSDAYRKCRYHCFDGVPLQALDCLIHELFGSVAALFYDATRRSSALLQRICKGSRRP